jgi:hypothetical protein
VILGVFTWSAYQSGVSSQAIQNDVAVVLDQPRYQNLSVVEVDIEYEDRIHTRRPVRVIVTVTSPGGEIHPRLNDQINQRINQQADRDIETQVRFVGVATSE